VADDEDGSNVGSGAALAHLGLDLDDLAICALVSDKKRPYRNLDSTRHKCSLACAVHADGLGNDGLDDQRIWAVGKDLSTCMAGRDRGPDPGRRAWRPDDVRQDRRDEGVVWELADAGFAHTDQAMSACESKAEMRPPGWICYF